MGRCWSRVAQGGLDRYDGAFHAEVPHRNPKDAEQFGKVFDILNSFFQRLWSQKKKGLKLQKLTIECHNLN
jgi:hypothetical protein